MLSLLLLAGTLLGPAAAGRVYCNPSNENIYQFSAMSIYENETISMEDYAGKVVLVYNTANFCGLTVANFNQINALAEQFLGQDLVILGFPCHQFGMQEPGANADEILNEIRYVRPGGNFEAKVTQFFKKCDVNGKNELPLYTYLKGTCDITTTDFMSKDMLFYEPLKVGDIYWNFEKFLVARDGTPYARYPSSELLTWKIAADIKDLLAMP